MHSLVRCPSSDFHFVIAFFIPAVSFFLHSFRLYSIFKLCDMSHATSNSRIQIQSLLNDPIREKAQSMGAGITSSMSTFNSLQCDLCYKTCVFISSFHSLMFFLKQPITSYHTDWSFLFFLFFCLALRSELMFGSTRKQSMKRFATFIVMSAIYPSERYVHFLLLNEYILYVLPSSLSMVLTCAIYGLAEGKFEQACAQYSSKGAKLFLRPMWCVISLSQWVEGTHPYETH